MTTSFTNTVKRNFYARTGFSTFSVTLILLLHFARWEKFFETSESFSRAIRAGVVLHVNTCVVTIAVAIYLNA